MKLRKRASGICIYQDKILCFKAIDPTNHKDYHFLPGGKIEENESPQSCVERETFEETGYKVSANKDSEMVASYIFPWDGEDYISTTYFYLIRLSNPLKAPQTVKDADYNKGVVWIDVKDFEKTFAYHPMIQLVVKKFIDLSRVSIDLR